MKIAFSPIGTLFLLMLVVPNLIWTKNKPTDYEKYAQNENRTLLLFERVGEVLVSCASVLLPGCPPATFSVRSLSLAAAFLLMLLYEFYWFRYFHSSKTMACFYSSLLGIPVAGATLPVAAFLLLGIYEKNIPLFISTVVLGIGHIGIHINHRREIM